MQRTGRGYGRQQQMIVSYTMEGDKGLRNADSIAGFVGIFSGSYVHFTLQKDQMTSRLTKSEVDSLL